MFYRFEQDATILAVDVDYITITGNSHIAVQRFKDKLSSCYGIKDRGNLCWLLGIRQGSQELNDLFFPSHLHTENNGTLQDGRCEPTVHTSPLATT